MANFGVNSSVIATVITVFMLGLAIGTAWAGRWTRILEDRFQVKGLRVYAGFELVIGIGGLAVPAIFEQSRNALLALGTSDSWLYMACAAILLTAALLPFCVAMGCTFPAALSFLKRRSDEAAAAHSFSYLYLANVCGAVVGVILPVLILIESLGFHSTLRIASATNFLIAILAYAIPADPPDDRPDQTLTESGSVSIVESGNGLSDLRTRALFLTGFSSMGMEVIWTRMYPLYLSTLVYSFAGILATYLIATTIGTARYRRHAQAGRIRDPWRLWIWLIPGSILPLVATRGGLNIPAPLRLILGIAPLCALLGYLTPCLIDDYAQSAPIRAARAYSLNLLGCVIGPIVSGFVLIPFFGVRIATVLLLVPLVFLARAPAIRKEFRGPGSAVIVGTSLILLLITKPFEAIFPKENVRYDHYATVVVWGEGMDKKMLVNGVSITHLTPITKMMVHFPMAHLPADRLDGAKGLVLCMGMGTSFRSLMSWGVDATAVELVPSVPEFFSYFFPDATALLSAPARRGRIIIDDSRRFLDRSSEMFDLITIDPPPPVEAARSSLLYSKEFYRSVLRRLNRGGILHTWLPGGDAETQSAVTRSLLESFAHVRTFGSVEGWGLHYLASQEPIPRISPPDLVARMPPTAVVDMTEWNGHTPEEYFSTMMENEIDPRLLLIPEGSDRAGALTDNRPVNEFFLIRRFLFPTRLD